MSQQLGRYELLRPIGRGGMAEVWLARRRGAAGVQKRLVVKRILREHSRDPRLLSLFVQEAQVSMSLSHKNVVPVFDFGRVGDELFLVMELVDGPNWRQAVTTARAANVELVPVLAGHVMLEACQALEYAHTIKNDEGQFRHIAHRDVTPSNILLSFSGEVKLADFGIAVATAETGDQKIGLRGTPGYMAPEQARGEAATPSTDLFALGVVLWEALAGKHARSGEVSEQLRAAREDSLEELPEHVPEKLRQIVQRATAAKTEERYASASEMAAALDDFILAERSATGSRKGPLDSRLATWLARLYPDGLPRLSLSNEAMKGQVATYLDDGAGALLEGTSSTMRSLAETVLGQDEADSSSAEAGSSSADASDAQREASSRSPSKTAPSLWRRTALVLVPAGAAALFWILWPGAGQGKGASASGRSFDAAIASENARPAKAGASRAAHRDASLADAGLDAALDAQVKAQSDARVAIKHRKDKDAAPTGPAPERILSEVRVGSAPWAKVSVVGRSESCDETPCVLRLPPGRYTLQLFNPVARLKATAVIEVVLGKDQVVTRTLEPER